ncbi:MAG: hypothetical protein ABI921_12095 [Panacibacter sp.]
MGNFKTPAYLDYSFQQYQKIRLKKEKMYLSIFDKMTTEEISKYAWYIDFNNDDDEIKYDLLKERGIYLYFGNQFSDSQSDGIVLYKQGVIFFIWCNDFGEPILHAKIDFQFFSKVFEEYIQYCKVNHLFNT